MSLKSREARALATASTAALIFAGLAGATGAQAAVPSVPDVNLEYTCKYPIVDKQPLSIKVSSNIPTKAQLRVNQPAFQINATATAGGDTARAINTLNAYSIQGSSEAFADLEFPDGFIQDDLFVPLVVEPWIRPNSDPVTGNLVLTAKGDTPSVQLEPVGNALIRLDRITLNLVAKGQSGNIINVRKLTTDFDGNPIVPADSTPNDFNVYCKLNPGQSNLIATIEVVDYDPNAEPNKAPSKVVGLKSTAKSTTSVDLAWDAASDPDTGDAVKEYKVYQGTTLVKTVAAPATSVKVDGLTAATAYSFSVEAVDTKGPLAGPKSDALSVTTDPIVVPNTPPSQVTGLASPAKTTTTVDLTWNAATDADAGDAIKEYKVYAGANLVKTVAAPATSVKVDNLTPDTDYSFSVEAIDTKGPINGARSAALAVKTNPVIVECTKDTKAPSMPGAGAYLPDNSDIGVTTLNVRWGASTDSADPADPTCPVSGLDYYLVTSENEPDAKVPAGTLNKLFSDLGPDSEYRFTISAVDKAGNKSDAADELLITKKDITPVNAPPSVPGNFKGVPGTTTVELSWDASTDVDGTIAGYNVYRGSDKLATVTTLKYTATALTANTSYDFVVEAVDNKGALAATEILPVKTNPIVVIENKAPSKVVGLKSTAKSTTSVDLAWDAASDPDAGDSIKEYKVYQGAALVKTVAAPATSVKIEGLTAATAYSFSVEAVDTKGPLAGPKSDALSVTTDPIVVIENKAPSKVVGLKSTAKSTTSVDLAWDAASDPDAGDSIKEYKVYQGAALVKTVAAPATSVKIEGLTAATAYSFSVEAVDTKGPLAGPKSDALSVTTDPIIVIENKPPTQVVGVKGVAGTTNVKLTWDAATDPDGTVAKYNVYQGASTTPVKTVTATNADITGLTAATAYKFTVEAVDNKAKAGAKSAALDITTLPVVVGTKVPVVKSIIGKVAFAKIGGVALVQGTNFTGVKSVTVGGKPATVSPITNGLLLVILPPLAKGSYPLVVTNADGASAATPQTTIKYISLF